MIFRMILFFCLAFLISCSTPSTPHHKILGTTYGFSGPGTEIITDAKINKLRVRHVRLARDECSSGFIEHLEISGEIGPDSTAAIARLLPKLGKCYTSKTDYYSNQVYLSSGGGYLSDGYALGNLFKKYGVQTEITGGQKCASSCAIAFLGGKWRKMSYDSELLFHAPYIPNGLAIDCSDRGQVSNLKSYFKNALGEKNGDFLFDRTMSYCSSDAGWTINADAAKIFGITN
jgi:hypothetical protein